MTGEKQFVLAILVIMLVVAAVFAALQASKNRHRIKRAILKRLNFITSARPYRRQAPEHPDAGFKPEDPAVEESKAELARLYKLIEDRKLVARENDISYHLWGLYKNHFRNSDSRALDQLLNDGEWYDVKILHANTKGNLKKFTFELKGVSYKFVDNEEKKGWSDNIKLFSLYLYDDSDRCLIEIPMKVKVDKWGRNYSISSDGPAAFLPGEWIKDFINVKLKHQSIRNQEIRTQKHQERLSEIEELKERFGIQD